MLNADRQYRLQRLNDPTRFQRHPDDTLTPAITRDNPRPLATLDTTDPFNPNPTTLAAALAEDAAGSFYSAQASAGGGTYAGVPATVTQAVAAELAGYDLATADTFKENGIVYIQFANGDQFAINGLGAIANTKTTAVSGGLQTIATDFDGTSVNLNQSSDGTNSVVAKDAQGLSTASFTASANQSNVTSYSAPGQVANVLTTLATASGYQSELIDAQGTVLQTTQMHAYDDGSSLATTTYPSGASTTLTTAPDNTSQQLDTPAPNSGQDPNTLAITLRDAAGAITATGSRTVNPIDGSFEEALLGSATPGQPNGTLSARSVSATGEVSPKLDKAALDNLNQNAQYFNDSYSLINAIKNRQPLPILTSGIQVYNNITHDAPPMLLNAASALGAASSVYGLLQALQKGDVPQALVAGASAFTQGVTAYVNIAYGGDAILAASEGLGNVIGAASAVSQVLPFLGIANDLANRGGREVILDMPAIRRIKNHSYKRRYRETQTVRKLCKHRTHDFKRQFIPNIGMKNHTFKLRYSNASATNDFAWKVAV